MKNKAYVGTEVHWAQSQTGIVRLLNQRGIREIRFTNLEQKFALEFRATDGLPQPISVRIVVPIAYRGDSDEKRGKELNRLHRVLFYHLKAKFVAIDNDLTEFMEEFMSHLVVTDKSGNSSTMAQVLLPQYTRSLESGEQKEFKLLAD